MTTEKILGDTYIVNGRVADTADFTPHLYKDLYYEVVRVMEGKILFLDDHLDRLKHSLSGSGISYPGGTAIVDNLRMLQVQNEFREGNIRICIQKRATGDPDLLCYFVPYFYPEECTYLSGVQLVSYPYQRSDPGIKKWDDTFRVSVRELIRTHGVYEAALLNKRNEITEGSRSNIFFIGGDDRLVTPPSKDVLPGITREHVLRICREEGIGIMERPVALNDLDGFPSCFISGTSPKVLPVWQLDSFRFRVDHPVTRRIMELFESIIQNSLTDLLA